jgi:hypothetical protein
LLGRTKASLSNDDNLFFPHEAQGSGNGEINGLHQNCFYYVSKGVLFGFLSTLFNTASSTAHQIPLCLSILGSLNQGLLQRLLWQ